MGFLIAMCLFVGVQLIVYWLYQMTRSLFFSLLPNLGILVFGVILGIVAIVLAPQTPGSWLDLIGVVLIMYAAIGSGLSTLVSFLMIYILKQRKNQPRNE